MWPEFSSVNTVNLVKKSAIIPQIYVEFFLEDCFLLAHPVVGKPSSGNTGSRLM